MLENNPNQAGPMPTWVGLVVVVGGWVGNREAGLPWRVLAIRGVGAGLLFLAVWAILA
ncbi:MAG: hypothetical protein ACEQSM_09220 [Aliarcobacter sp.]